MLSQTLSLNRLRMYEKACTQQAESAKDEITRDEMSKLADAFRKRREAIVMSTLGNRAVRPSRQIA
jgi:hypothetical protein